MTIKKGDFVRAINPKLGLPPGSVWVADGEGWAGVIGISLEPFNRSAKAAPATYWLGKRFSPDNFEKVIPTGDGWQAAPVETDWVTANDEAVRNFLEKSTIMQELADQPTSSAPATVVDVANSQLASAANAVKDYQHLLQNARDLESARRQALRRAKAAQAKADKEAAAKAKVVEAKRQLAARLHADRCLADATLELIGEVSRLNNGGPEKEAPAGVAMHATQLQPLAKSYGYRIVKPSIAAIVVKL